MSRSKGYWRERSEQRLIDAEQKALRYETDLKKQFDRAARDLEQQICRLYAKYAEDNELTYADARRYLTNNEFAEFKKDLQFYIDHAKDENYRKEYRAYLQALSTRARIKRIETFKTELRRISEDLYTGQLEPQATALMADIFSESFNHTTFDFMQYAGVALSFSRPSRHVVDALLTYPWSGKNFTQKWQSHCSNFNEVLEDVLTRGLIQGKSVQSMARELRDKTVQPLKNAQRLVRTEANFIHNSATASAYAEFGVEDYEYLATLDSRTSPICREMDGKRFKLPEKVVGVNYPPLHAWCRSTTIPVVDEDVLATRIARDTVTGKNIKVPASMTYEQWHRQYVSNGGLGSGNFTLDAKRRPPKFVEKIDVANTKLVESRLSKFRDRVIYDAAESAYVILPNGKSYHFTGGKDRVYPDVLGKALKGAIMSHNHPIGETAFSFSKDDFDFFQRHRLAELRGFDEKYEYVLRRAGRSPQIEKAGLLDMTKEQYNHQMIHELAERDGVYYERIERAAASRRE